MFTKLKHDHLVPLLFFFKQKTAYEMCGRDWSSDVCSSDLSAALRGEPVKLVVDSNPRVAAALDDIRALFTAADRLKGVRRLTRIHVHTLAFQAIVTVKGEKHVGVTPPGVTSFICIIFVSRL